MYNNYITCLYTVFFLKQWPPIGSRNNSPCHNHDNYKMVYSLHNWNRAGN